MRYKREWQENAVCLIQGGQAGMLQATNTVSQHKCNVLSVQFTKKYV